MGRIGGLLVLAILLALPPSLALVGAPSASPPLALAAHGDGRAERGQGAGQRDERDRSAKRDRDGKSRCEAAGLIWLDKAGVCTHGPDAPPPGTDVGRSVLPLPPGARGRALEAFVCDGDGTTGYRVEVLYVRAEDVPSRYARYLDSFRAWVADADAVMRGSSAGAASSRRFRFVTNPDCSLKVTEVVLPANGDDTFDQTVAGLKQRGYGRTDRIYLAFVDTTSAGICGLGSRWLDDRSGAGNWNNAGPSYSRVDAGCWSFDEAVAHELMHNLGGVQDSAPNSSNAGHCVDEYDIMCYPDGGNGLPVMRIVCTDQRLGLRYDCRQDDYFNPAPPPGSYLDTHWNTANSRFLVVESALTPDIEEPIVAWITPEDDGEWLEVASGPLAVKVEATDNVGVAQVEFSLYADDATVGASPIWSAKDTKSPYEASIDIDSLEEGYYTLTAEATDALRNRGSAVVFLSRVPLDVDAPVVSWVAPTSNGSTYPVPDDALWVDLEVSAADAGRGMDRVIFSRRFGGSGPWVEITTAYASWYAADEPYTAWVSVSDLAMGANEIRAEAVDVAGNRSSSILRVERGSTVVRPSPGTVVKPGSTVPVGIAVDGDEVTVEVRVCPGTSCAWPNGTGVGTDAAWPHEVLWRATKPGTYTLIARATANGGTHEAGPVTVTVAKKKKKK